MANENLSKERKMKKFKTIKKYYPVINEFAKANSQQRKKAIAKMNDECINALCECCFNVLNNPKLTTPKQKKELKKTLQKYKTDLCFMCEAKINKKVRRAYCCVFRNCIGVLCNVLEPVIRKNKLHK